jgi:hypothetical protein
MGHPSAVLLVGDAFVQQGHVVALQHRVGDALFRTVVFVSVQLRMRGRRHHAQTNHHRRPDHQRKTTHADTT